MEKKIFELKITAENLRLKDILSTAESEALSRISSLSYLENEQDEKIFISDFHYNIFVKNFFRVEKSSRKNLEGGNKGFWVFLPVSPFLELGIFTSCFGGFPR